ncbi:MAG TPA: ABC transporter ATP-binding protein [Symbiobacteriaceae bacterium]|nr:ABC transporter ATP-binding protein [Symbiobacteriaceae bacterium]
MNDTLVELQNVLVLRHTDPTGLFGLWGAKPVRALDGVSLTLRRGETLGIMGGAGGGKTTLAETVTMRRQPDRGRILFEGKDVTKAGGNDRKKLQRRLQMIRQDARESLEMDRTVRKQLEERMREYGLPDAEGRMRRAITAVELPEEFLDRTPVEMSGGQQQRVAIARALALGPILVAADEPVSGVDPQLQRDLLNMLDQVQKQQNLAYLLISHERRTISRLAHRVAVLDRGHLYELSATERVFSEAKHPYSRLFLGIERGELPFEEDLTGRTFTGCPFAEHCPAATERCRAAKPALREVAEGHFVACHEV